jgi:pantoate--beta-alanine ligase
VFVNPTQFAPQEDYQAYPRSLREDAIAAESAGAHLIFAPTAEGMYAPDASTFVNVEGLADGLCGRFRPGHFRGVTTVVTKLFNIIQPERAYFGLKDYQQYAVVKRMARDLNLPVEIVGVPTVREADGLAMSSRNAYLTPEERALAPALYQALQQAAKTVREGATVVQARETAAQAIAQVPQMQVQYLEAVHPETLELADYDPPPVLLTAAVVLGQTRLMDNIIVDGE